MAREFDGKVALITGAAAGIGATTAILFASKGVRVVVSDIDSTGGEQTVEAIKAQGGTAIFVKADVSQEADVKALVDQTLRQFNRLDYAFNNAGIEGPQAPTAAVATEDFDRIIAINLRGVWLSMKYEIPPMLSQGGGAIVNMSSIAGVVGSPGVPAYVASKHGVVGLTKNAALEYSKQGLRVNAVCPAVIDTPMIERFTKGDEQNRQQMSAMHPVGRMGTAEEVANAVIWLCSDKASFVTGHIMPVDGGYTAQ